MKSDEIRRQFLDFLKKKGHKVVPSSSLIPDDPSVLLTTAGMQQFKRYFTGELDPVKDFGSKNTVSIQKCFRTSDIDEIGDESHLTFFEMLGNFSFGGYWKKEAIEYAHEFIAKEMGLEIDYVSVFVGDKDVPKDEESKKIWQNLGLKDIREAGREDNFWGPTGSEGPCGPTTEIYVNGVEIWNIVFNEFYCDKDKKLTPLKIKGVDTGMGLERLAMVSQNVPTIFETDLFEPLLMLIPSKDTRIKRIISDHIRGSIHLISDGIQPSNKDRGYILRRILRRAIFHIALIVNEETLIPLDQRIVRDIRDGTAQILHELVKSVINLSGKEVKDSEEHIWAVIDNEIGSSVDLLKLVTSKKKIQDAFLKYRKTDSGKIPGEIIFSWVSTYGIPFDYLSDEARKRGLLIDEEGFEIARKAHQEISRAGQEKKFGGHGLILNTGELKAGSEEELKMVTRLHTATHLLQQALRDVLGPDVKQAGSDITIDRTRFDFSFPRKLTPDEIRKVDEIVNREIKGNLPVNFKEMSKSEAEKIGALHFFREKYPEKVKVYYIGESLEKAYSKEFCGGPHVSRTGEIGRFKIIKDEAVGAGSRRIRATVE